MIPSPVDPTWEASIARPSVEWSRIDGSCMPTKWTVVPSSTGTGRESNDNIRLATYSLVLRLAKMILVPNLKRTCNLSGLGLGMGIKKPLGSGIVTICMVHICAETQ